MASRPNRFDSRQWSWVRLADGRRILIRAIEAKTIKLFIAANGRTGDQLPPTGAHNRAVKGLVERGLMFWCRTGVLRFSPGVLEVDAEQDETQLRERLVVLDEALSSGLDAMRRHFPHTYHRRPLELERAELRERLEALARQG